MENAVLRELREKAARAVRSATEIRDSLKGVKDWPADKQAAFDAAMADYGETMKEVQKLENREKQFADLDAGIQTFLTPQDRTTGVPAVRSDDGKPATKAHKEAFSIYLKHGEQAVYAYASRQQLVPATEIHALLSTDAQLGGFTVPEDFQAELLRKLPGYTAIRPLARVQPTMRDTLVWPAVVRHATDVRRTSGFAGTWRQQGYVTGGTAPTVQNQPRFRQERIPIHSWQPDAVEISPELSEDSAVDLAMLLADLIAETLGFDEDDVFLKGTGVNEPEGILQAGISTVNSGDATKLTYGGLVDLYTSVPAQYRQRSTFMINSGTYGAMLKLEDKEERPLFPVNQLIPNLWGRPIVFHESVDAVGAGNKPIIFGDFSQYIIASRQGLRVQRLVERFAPNVGFLPTARCGGQVVQVDAFRVQNVAA